MEAVVGRMPVHTCVKNDLGSGFKENCRTYPPKEGNLKLRAAKSLKNKQKPSYRKYGERIPDLMKALKLRKSIEEVLGPCEATLSAKDMSLILNHQSNWERAVEIFRWFQEKGCYQINVFHYNILLKILGRAKKWDYLNKFWEEMVRNEVSPTNITYATVIDSYGKAGLTEEALLWFDHMTAQGLHPDKVTISTVVHILEKAGEYDKAAQFQDWCGGKQSPSGPDLSFKGVANYSNKTMDPSNGDAENGRLRKAGEVLQKMLKPGFSPDDTTRGILCDLLMKRGISKCMVEQLDSSHKDGIMQPLISIVYSTLGMNNEGLEALEPLGQLQTLNPDISFCNAIINAFGSAGRIDEASKMFTSLHARGLEPDATTYRYMLDLYIRVGLVSEAQEIFQHLKEKGWANEWSFSLILSLYNRKKRYNEAIEIAEEMLESEFLTNIPSFNNVIQLYVEEGRLREAAKVLQKMLNVGVSPNKTTCKLLGVLLVKGGVIKWIAEQLESSHRDYSIQPLIGTVYSIVGMNDEALETLGLLSELWSLNPDLPLCNAIIYAFGTAGRISEASEMFMSLRARGIKLDTTTYRYMLDVYRRAGLVSEAQEIFQHIKEKGWANEWSFTLMLSLCKRNKRYNEAIEIAKEMLESGFVTKILSFNNVIWLYVEEGRLREAAEILQKMLNRGISPDKSTCEYLGALLEKGGITKWIAKELESSHKDCIIQPLISTVYSIVEMNDEALEALGPLSELWSLNPDLSFCNAIIYALGTVGRIDEASKMFMSLRARGLEPDITTYRYMLDLYRRAGLVSEVQKIFQHLKEKGWANEWSFALILSFYKKKKRYDKAIEIAEEMLQLGFLTNILSFNNVIEIYVEEGRLREAAKVLQKMSKLGISSDKTTCRLLCIFLMKGGIKEWTAKHLESCHKDCSMQPLISTFYSIVGMNDEALEALGPLSELQALILDLSFYNSIIYAFGTVGKIVEASKMFMSMHARGLEPDSTTYRYMLDLYTRAGLVGEAQEIFQHLKEKGWANEQSFALILSLYKKNRRFDKVMEIGEEMLQSGLLSHILSFNNVIELYVEHGRLREAAKVLQKMLNLGVPPSESTCELLGALLVKGGVPKWRAEQLKSCHKDTSIQPLISTVYHIVGMKDEALQALGPLSELQNLNPNLSFCNASICAFCIVGRFNEAYKMFVGMHARGLEPDKITYTNMIIAFGKLGSVEGVRRMFHQMKQKGFQPDDYTFEAIIDTYRSAGRDHLVKLVTQERDFRRHLQ